MKKAMSELNASKNPMKFIEDNKNMSIKGLRGIAFADGGTVPTQLTDDDVNSFLDAIKQNESSGGTNTAHRTMQSGIHEGDTAIGQYGMMPNTIRELANRAKMQHIETPEMANIAQSDDMKQDMTPDVESQFAHQLAAKLLNQFKGNQGQAAYAWNQGHNLTPEQVQQRDYMSSLYVQKFLRLKALMNQK